MKPIGQLLREKARQKQLQSQTQAQHQDEEPKVIEAKRKDAEKKTERLQSLLELEKKIQELENSDSSESDDDNDDDEEESDSTTSDIETNTLHSGKKRKVQEIEAVEEETDDSLVYVRDKKGNIVRIISSLSREASIQPLPASLLPNKKCKFTPNAQVDGTKNRKIGFADERQSKPSNAPSGQHGFLRTVKEVMDAYVPASLEKRPFFCRICVFQGQDLQDFEAHRASAAHIEAVSKESKICFCKLCRKKFTSPAQLSEHLQGKAHKERLEHVKSAHQDRKKFC